jgi:hypothetical protein
VVNGAGRFVSTIRSNLRNRLVRNPITLVLTIYTCIKYTLIAYNKINNFKAKLLFSCNVKLEHSSHFHKSSTIAHNPTDFAAENIGEKRHGVVCGNNMAKRREERVRLFK